MKDLLKKAEKDFYRMWGGKTASVKASNIPRVALPAGPMITREGLIAELNEDLILEYTAALQYIQHYARMEGAGFGSITKELLVHANEEIEHAVKLSDRIAFMGGVPVVGTKDFKVSSESEIMLRQDLHDEKVAVARYKQRIMQALSLGEFGLADMLQDILLDEEEHQNDLETALANKVPKESPYPRI